MVAAVGIAFVPRGNGRSAERSPGCAAALTLFLLLALTQDARADVPASDKLLAVALISGVCVLIFGSVAAFFYVTGRKYGALATASAAWPTVQGKVIRCGVIMQRRPNGGSTYRSDICYEYTAAGARREGNVIRFGNLDLATEPAAQKILDPYPAGTVVTVHYQPDNPAVAVLETSPGAAEYRLKFARWTVVAGIGFYIVLVGFALFSMS
jgi:hypothetical protein